MSSSLPLVLEDVSFEYRTRPGLALKNVSVSVQPGELLLVAGASGCGKSTLIRCINGLIPRSYGGTLTGSVRVYGDEVRTVKLSKLAQTIGTLLQDPEKQILGAYVHAEVAFGPENLGLPIADVQERVTRTLQRLGIERLRERETFALSGGEKQKIALAGALALEPSILLLDEPLASLDPASAQEALALFRHLCDQGTTIVLVEHRVEDALAARPDRVLYMEAGEVRYLGAPDGLTAAVDWRRVKLPAAVVLDRLRTEGRPAAPPTPRSQPTGEPLISFANVHFGYGDGPEILHDISLEIRAGERVALLGPNGTGKSTLVKHAIGLVKPRSGKVLIGGKPTAQQSVAQVAQTVGYAFQSPTQMLFAPTVSEELAFGPRNLGFKPVEIEASSTEALRLVNLPDAGSLPPLALSFGQQKRVTIACVAAMRSRILALDEPTAGQDFFNYMSFMDGLMQAADLDSRFDAFIFITHDVDLAVIFATRVILMSQGRIAADGPPETVLADEDLLSRCRVVPTTLLRENLRRLPRTGRFLRIEDLAAQEEAPIE